MRLLKQNRYWIKNSILLNFRTWTTGTDGSYKKSGHRFLCMNDRAYIPEIPDLFWDEFNELVGKEEMKVLLDRVILFYNKYMSCDAIKQLIKMFFTSFLEEWKQKMPAISRKPGPAGSEWTHKLLQAESFKKKLDNLVSKYGLEKLNSTPKKPPLKEKPNG